MLAGIQRVSGNVDTLSLQIRSLTKETVLPLGAEHPALSATSGARVTCMSHSCHILPLHQMLTLPCPSCSSFGLHQTLLGLIPFSFHLYTVNFVYFFFYSQLDYKQFEVKAFISYFFRTPLHPLINNYFSTDFLHSNLCVTKYYRIKPLIWPAKPLVIWLPVPSLFPCPAPHPVAFTQPSPPDYAALHPQFPFSPLVHYTHLCLPFLSPLHLLLTLQGSRQISLPPGQNLDLRQVPFLGTAGSPCARPHHSITLLCSPSTGQTFQRWKQLEARAVTISSPGLRTVLNLSGHLLSVALMNESVKQWSGAKEEEEFLCIAWEDNQCPRVRRRQLQARLSWLGSHVSGCAHGQQGHRVNPTSGWSPIPFVMAVDGTPNPANGCCGSRGNL